MQCKTCGVAKREATRFYIRLEQCSICYDRERRAKWSKERRQRANEVNAAWRKRQAGKESGVSDLMRAWGRAG